MNSLVSIIVPIYNVGKKLHRCIDAILNQEYKRFELILVDDGSKDGSGEICDKYALLDERVFVIHQDNAGASAARNTGIKVSKGKYIAFSDADDWMDTKWLISMINSIEDVDLVISGFYEYNFKQKCKRKQLYNKKYTEETFSLLVEQLLSLGQMGYLWTMLFKNELIKNNNIFLNESIKYQEDLDFILRYCLHCKSIKTISNCSYCYDNLEVKSYCHNLFDIDLVLNSLAKILSTNFYSEWERKYCDYALISLLKKHDKENVKKVKLFIINRGWLYFSTTGRLLILLLKYMPLPLAILCISIINYCCILKAKF